MGCGEALIKASHKIHVTDWEAVYVVILFLWIFPIINDIMLTKKHPGNSCKEVKGWLGNLS